MIFRYGVALALLLVMVPMVGCGGGSGGGNAYVGDLLLYDRFPSRSRPNDSDIYTINCVPQYMHDSNNRLVQNPSAEFNRITNCDTLKLSSRQPVISPDGTQIAFTLQRASYSDLAIMNADGSNLRILTNSSDLGGEEGYSPNFSPDGTKIVYASRMPGGYICTINVDGTGREELAGPFPGSYDAPEYSPDGTKIVFSQSGQIWIMDADGGNSVQLTHHNGLGSWPTFSPDGTKIAYELDWDIHIMNADGSNPVKLTHSEGFNLCPAFSPDGMKIAFQSDRGSGTWSELQGDYEIFVMNLDGSKVQRITYGGGRSPSWIPAHLR